jgi:hypothetical protein
MGLSPEFHVPDATPPKPSIAVWLLNLFVLSEEADPIPGDLLAEFSLLVSKLGVVSTRRWQLLCPEACCGTLAFSSRKSRLLRRPETVTEALEPV